MFERNTYQKSLFSLGISNLSEKTASFKRCSSMIFSNNLFGVQASFAWMWIFDDPETGVYLIRSKYFISEIFVNKDFWYFPRVTQLQ